MSGFKVNFSVNNQLATPSIHAAPFAQRPAAGQPGRVFIDSDNPSTGIYRDTGTTWVAIGNPSSPEVDTLQIVTGRGNTTTNSITVGAATSPVGTIDVRRTTAALNGANDWALVSVNSPTIPSGASFGVNYVNAVYGSQALTFSGNATIGNTGINAAGNFINSLQNNASGTITVAQGSGTIRAIAGVQAGIYYNTPNAMTFTHVAGIKTLQPINSGAVGASVTNYYGVQIADSTPSSGTISYTNQWGIYQEGANDQNFFAGNVILKNFTGTAVGSLRVRVDGGGYGISVQGTSGTDVTQYNSRNIVIPDGSGNNAVIESVGSAGLFRFTSPSYQFRVTSGLVTAINIPSNGRVLVNTTTDAGFTFQVNGTTQTTALRISNGNIVCDNTFIGNAFCLQGTTDLYFYNNSSKRIITNGTNINIFAGLPQLSTQTTLVVNDAGGTLTGYKIQQWQTGSVEKAYLDRDGNFATLTSGYIGSIGTINASAILQADSTTKGFLPPRMTDTQITAIATPAAGLMVYSTTQACPAFYDGTGWRKISHSAL